MRRRIPLPVVVLAAVGVAFVLLPLLGLVARAPWSEAAAVLTSSSTLTALRLSLVVSTCAALVTLVLGFPLALVLARPRFPGQAAVRGLVILPLVIPPVVAGIALLAAFGRRGVLGGPLAAAGVQLPFTTAGAVVATAFVALPLLVLSVESGLRSLDPGLENAAATMGASSWYRFRRVTIPVLRPQIIAGLILAWARALGEFGATLMFAGNLEGKTQTLPLAAFQASQTDPGASLLIAMLLVVLSLAVLIALRGRLLAPR